MPVDLIVAVGTIVAISMGAGVVGARSRRWPRLAVSIAAITAVVILVLWAVWLSDNPLLTRVCPLADCIAWANLQTPAVGLLAGLAWAHLATPKWQKFVLVGALVGIGAWRLAGPYIGGPPVIGPARWTHGVCMQSSTSTCSAASAATVLAAAGIKATEAEMSRLCLTHANGTTLLGLYRGLKLKTTDTRWDVVAFSCPADDLIHWPLPAIITIGLPGATDGLLSIGNRHSVVLLRFTSDGNADIGDPFSGRQSWSRKELRKLYRGTGMALISSRP